ncbi:MAG: restriction endonuclease subunit S [Methylococcaceae bacterium]
MNDDSDKGVGCVTIGLPCGWANTKLDDVADILDFERQPINSSERNERISGKNNSELFAYYGATGQVGWIDGYRTEGQRILLGEDGAPFLDPSKDKAFLVNGRFWVNNHAHVLQGAAGLIDNRFLCYQLNMVDYQPHVSGSTRLKLTNSAMKQILLLVAPANEQTRIVEKIEELLSDLDTGVAELKAAQKKLVQYRQSLLKAAVEGALTAEWRTANQPKETGTQLLERILIERRARWEVKQLAKFKEQGKAPPKDWQAKYPEPVKPDTNDLPELPEGWVWASIDQVAEVFLGKMLDKTKHTSGAKMPYLRNVNVRWGNIQTHDISEMFFENDELDRYGLLAGDVLVCEGGEPGRAAICNKKHEILKYQKALHRVRLFDLYEPELLVAFLEFSAKTGRLEKNFTGSTINHFTKESFLALQIPIAPLNEQREIVETLLSATNTIDEQKSALEVAFKQSAAQRKNILKTAFSGQLVPQDPNDEPASVLLERIRNERQNNKIPIKRHRR